MNINTPTPVDADKAHTETNIEEQTLIVSTHVIIRDAVNKQVLVNKRGS
jgi:hypothetical protein